mgnify:CR=1 FL=1
MDRLGWYRRSAVTRWLTYRYFRWLRYICQGRRERRRLLKCCVRCRIRFLTVDSNRRRTDLLCAFGCQEEQRRDQTNARGRRLYRTEKGRNKKKTQNRKRSLNAANQPGNDQTAVAQAAPAAPLFTTELLHYIAYLMLIATGKAPPLIEIEQFLNEALTLVTQSAPHTILRQRTLPGRGS